MPAGAYYNEHDAFAAGWLRNLIALEHIAPGDVDERSIEDVAPDDLRGYSQHHFFAGIGVWSAALRAAGWADDRPVWTGSCPCQPFSAAGKGGGFADERHLWPSWFWLIRELRPDVLLGEQVASPPGLQWFDLVSADLEGAAYAVAAADLCAAGVGAPHIRQRLFFVAQSSSSRGRRDPRAILGAQGSGCREGIEARCLTDQLVDDGPVVDAAGEQAGLPRRAWEPGRAGELAHDDDERRQSRGSSETGSKPGTVERPAGFRSAVVLGDDDDARLAQRPIEDVERRAVREEGSAPGPAGLLRGQWRDAEWIPCRDGKWRPVEPGTFPLAHGATARVGRLRGYGNAIVLPLAQAFIETAMTVLP